MQKKWNAGEESATSLTGVPKSSRENSTIKKTIMHEKSQAGTNCFSLYLLKARNTGQSGIIAHGHFIDKVMLGSHLALKPHVQIHELIKFE